MLTLTRVRPLIGEAGPILDADELAELRRVLAPEALAASGLRLRTGSAGRTLELPIEHHPLLATLAGRIDALVGLPNALSAVFRLRWAGPGQSHPLHSDDYVIAGARLWITALVYLTEVRGGHTVFPDAEPPLSVATRAGHLIAWYNQGPDGEADPQGEHAFEPIEAGERLTLTWFVYAKPDAARAAWARAREAHPRPLLGYLDAAPGSGGGPGVERTLYCIDEAVPRETTDSLRAACAARSVGFVRVHAGDVDCQREPLAPGALLYAPATSIAADRAEQILWQPGVATFHRRPEGPFVSTVNPLLAFARAGLPVPRFDWLHTTDREVLDATVDALGGLPLVLKAGPGEGGVGTLRADSLPALYSIVDLLRARGTTPLALSFVPDALHLRLIVVGDRVVTAYRNPTAPNDFRSAPSDDPEDYDVPVEPAWAEVAVAASRVVGYAFAGVDLLVHPSGRVYLLEANFPCYFPQAEAYGADVSGAMVEYLLAQVTGKAGSTHAAQQRDDAPPA